MHLGVRRLGLFAGDDAGFFAFVQRLGLDSVQLDDIRLADVPAMQRLCEERGIGVSSIGAMSRVLLGPDMAASRAQSAVVREAIAVARALGAPCVSLFAGHDAARSFAENVETFRTVLSPLVEEAEQAGVTLVVENCPLVEGIPPAVRNFAYCPAAWDAMFDAVPSPALGLEFDTAHLPWLGIDLMRATRDYAGRIAHVHLKDCRIDREALYRYGNLGHEHYHYATPGEGEIDFSSFFSLLGDLGYQGALTFDLRPCSEETVTRATALMRPLLAQ